MTLKDELFKLLESHAGLTDREITDRLRGKSEPQQPVNIACRELASQGVIRREKQRPFDNLIGNYLTGSEGRPAQKRERSVNKDAGEGHLSEDDLKRVLVDWLNAQGWQSKVAWGKTQGIDIDASNDGQRWIIEVKGPGSRQPMRVNYFLAILGETLQRMSDEKATYSIALPDIAQFRALWNRLPKLSKSRTQISVIFVSPSGRIEHLVE